MWNRPQQTRNFNKKRTFCNHLQFLSHTQLVEKPKRLNNRWTSQPWFYFSPLTKLLTRINSKGSVFQHRISALPRKRSPKEIMNKEYPRFLVMGTPQKKKAPAEMNKNLTTNFQQNPAQNWRPHLPKNYQSSNET